MAQPYLIQIALGPVQEFIASARKLRDLWYGSFLLSELSKAVARSLAEGGCELIFPAPESPAELAPGSPLNVANKILALAPAGKDPADLVAAARKAFDARWTGICEDALTKARQFLSGQAIRESLFRQQIADFGEFYAAWTTCDPADYAGSRQRSEQLLAGRKTLRAFAAPTWDGAGVPKSSLDGIRESVLRPEIPDTCIVKKGEQLDALGVIKRYGPLVDRQRPHFDNMAMVSILPYLAGLERAAGENRDLAAAIADLPSVTELDLMGSAPSPRAEGIWGGWPTSIPVEWLHPAVMAETLRQYRSKKISTQLQELQRDLKKLWHETTEPHPYACLLVGDGDRLGKTLDRLASMAAHQGFSRALDRFARDVHPMMERYGGRVVYSGGDDIMAYLPLHTALAGAAALNESFCKAMAAACRHTGIETPPTFSLGLAIVHHQMPLHRALDLARRAEKYAKNKGGRNSLAIVQEKRSGSALTVCGKWQTGGGLPAVVDRISGYASKYSAGILPSRLGYQLREIAKTCGDTLAWQPDDKAAPGNAAAAEALRVIGRKRQSDGTCLAAADAAGLLAGHENLRQLSDELVIARQLGLAEEMASANRFRCKRGDAI